MRDLFLDTVMLPIVALTLEMLGTVLIAYTVLRVHDRVRREREIDSPVLAEMQRERSLVVLGIFLILAGYILQVVNIVL